MMARRRSNTSSTTFFRNGEFIFLDRITLSVDNYRMAAAISVIERAEDAAILLKAEHQRLLARLAVPNSAAGLARELGWSRQIVGYHLKEMERAGLIALQEERRRGNCTERVMRRTADAYLIGPQTTGELSSDPARMADKLSASYLMAVAAQAIKDVSRLSRSADAAGKTLPSLTLEAEVRFKNPRDRASFTAELTQAIANLVTKYNDTKSPEGRSFRLIAGAYPSIGVAK